VGADLDGNLEHRGEVQRGLDGGGKITRYGEVIEVDVQGTAHVFVLESPGRAVKFAAALNKLRRPLRLIKQDLDQDWAARVKRRDNYICAGCNVMGDKIGKTVIAHTEIDKDTGETRLVKERIKKDVLTAHHWLKTKSRAGMARWARPCGVTYHYAEHIHTLHENPCWVDLEKIYRAVAIAEGEEAIKAALALVSVEPTEARVRALWLERCGNKKTEVKA
jgi:hypothetical protein